MLAVYHDAGEVFTGDMPTPVKYFTEDLHDKYKEIEDKARRRLLETLPDELKDTYRPYILDMEMILYGRWRKRRTRCRHT